MGNTPVRWCAAVAVIPMVVPLSVMAQVSVAQQSAETTRNGFPAGMLAEPGVKKPPRRGRARVGRQPEERSAPNDWNPHYIEGRDCFVRGEYDKALIELVQNVADCDQIDFESMRGGNSYFDHIWNSISGMGQSPHAFIRASNLQWVGAALVARGEYDLAEQRFAEMETYAGRCFPGRLSTFEGCSCQAQAFVLAAQGRYDRAADRYRMALAHIEGNEAQIGLPPAPCVAMILAALADVELAQRHHQAASVCIRRAERVQEAQRELGIGPAPLDRATLMTIHAAALEGEQRSSEAYDLYAGALEIIGKIRNDHPSTAYCLDGLGEIDLERGRYDQGEDHFRQSLAVRRASLGESHREVAYSTLGLARIAAAKGKREDALTLYNQARAILVRELGPAHPDAVELDARLTRLQIDKQPHGLFQAGPRFLAIPTLVTVGWQVLHLGKDWRVAEANLRRRDARESRTAHRSSVPSHKSETAGIGR